MRWISVNDIFWEVREWTAAIGATSLTLLRRQSLWRVDTTDGEMKYFVAGPRKVASKEAPQWRVIGEREGG